MRDADGRGLEHRGVREQDLVDLTRIHLEPRDDDHLLLAIDDAEVAVPVHPDDVTGEEPAIAENAGGLFRALPVAVHEIRPAQTQLPRLAGGHLARSGLDVDDLAVDVGERQADRPGLADALTRI